MIDVAADIRIIDIRNIEESFGYAHRLELFGHILDLACLYFVVSTGCPKKVPTEL